jgi:hypothetical protein
MCIELHFEPRRSPFLSTLTPIEFNIFPLFPLLEDKLHSLIVPAVTGQTGVAFDDFIGQHSGEAGGSSEKEVAPFAAAYGCVPVFLRPHDPAHR